MKLSLHGQSTVAVEAPKGRIVIDPGPFSDLSCLEGAGAVLLLSLIHISAPTRPY